MFAVVSTVATPLRTSSATKVFWGGSSTVTVIVPEVYPVPPFIMLIDCIIPPSPKTVVAVAVPLLNVTSGVIWYPEPTVFKTNLLIAPEVSNTALAVAFWNGSLLTSVGWEPPAYPDPAPSKFTVPIPFLRITNDLVEKLDASDDPKTVLSWNPPIFRAPWIVLPNDIDLLTSK